MMIRQELSAAEIRELVARQNGVCPPSEQRTPEQRQVLARGTVLSVIVSLYADRYHEAMRKLALGTPQGCTPIPAAEVDAEVDRQVDAFLADVKRVFKAPAAPEPTVNPRGYNAEQLAALKRVVTLGPSLDDHRDPKSSEIAGRLAAALDRTNDRLGRHLGQGYGDQVVADIQADAEQLILDLERLF